VLPPACHRSQGFVLTADFHDYHYSIHWELSEHLSNNRKFDVPNIYIGRVTEMANLLHELADKVEDKVHKVFHKDVSHEESHGQEPGQAHNGNRYNSFAPSGMLMALHTSGQFLWPSRVSYGASMSRRTQGQSVR
jgi:hypothetical protein